MSIQLLLTPDQAAEQRARSALSKARKTTAVATNQALMRALGITQPNVVALQLSMHPQQLPTVTLDCLIDAAAMEHEVSHFELVLREDPKPAPVPAPRPALDLDAMCATARQRIAEAADNAAYRAKCEHLGESKLIRARLDQALLRRRTKVTAALAMLDVSLLVKDLVRTSAAMGGFFGGSLGGLASPSLTKAMSDRPRFEPIGSAFGGLRK